MKDNIVAISTLVGNSAINIIKLSGPKVIEIVNDFFSKDLTKVEGNTINYGFFKDAEEKIDEVLISVFRKPKSYTTEDVIEINCHGGVTSTKKILDTLLTHKDIRLAEPGEFIKRAFLNGRIDLIEAEAVGDLISSTNESARKLSLKGINGEVSQLIHSLRKDIMKILGNIEVNIDYPEYEDIEIITIDLLKKKIEEIKTKFKVLYENSNRTNIIKNGINVSIIGKPNVGKSSLLNKLLGEEKAIVTNVEGTTRDIIEGKINLDGITLNLIDTAGIRETEDIVEKIGVSKSLELLESTDLVIFVLSNDQKMNLYEKEILEKLRKKNTLVIINKTDLPRKIDIKELKDFEVIELSLMNDQSIENLLEKIKFKFNISEIKNSDFTYLSNSRQISILKKCLNLINEIEDSIKKEMPIDLIEIDIKQLWENLGEILGETYKDELLDEIFSNFCLGK